MDDESLILKLIRNEVSKFELIYEIERRGLDLSHDEEFRILKLYLQIHVIEEILKKEDIDCNKRDRFNEVLTTSKGQLLEEERLRCETKYECQIVGCKYQETEYRNILRHLRRCHSGIERIKCNFKKVCPRMFSSVAQLEIHFNSDHTIQSQRAENHPSFLARSAEVHCKCSFVNCRNREFRRISELTGHLNVFHKSDYRSCVFKNCDRRIKPDVASRHHFKIHYDKGETELKDQNLVQSRDQTIQMQMDTGDREVPYLPQTDTEEDNLDRSFEDVQEEHNNSHSHEEVSFDASLKDMMFSYANFLNELAHVQCIAASTVQKITDQFLDLSKLSHQYRVSCLFEALTRKFPDINKQDLESILRNQEDPFLTAQENLKTENARNQFIEQNFTHIPPVEIVLNEQGYRLGEKKDVVHYIPIKETLKAIYADKTYQDAVLRSNDKEKLDGLSDIKDGAVFQDSTYFTDYPHAIPLVMYSDGVETLNPLSYAKTKHKLTMVYFQCVSVPPHLRTIGNIQLVMVFKEKLVNKYGYEKIFQKLKRDLMDIENEGIKIELPFVTNLRASLIAYLGDNLESHAIGGFSKCFSSGSVCRNCLIKYDDLQERPHDYSDEGSYERWTREKYDNIIHSIENDEVQVVETHGITGGCVFNSLREFHATQNFPLDIMHDLLEGVIPIDLAFVIQKLVSLGWFTLASYNRALENFKFSSEEKKSRPQSVPDKAKKLKGKAISHWIHIRNFPLILMLNGWVKDSDNPVLRLGIKLNELTELVMAERLQSYELDEIEESTKNYLDFRMKLLDNYEIETIKPKHHFVTHVKENVYKFGPSRATWTALYETKHRQVKKIVENSKNFKNISMTVATRHQFRMSSKFYTGLYQSDSDFVLPLKVLSCEDIRKTKENEEKSLLRFCAHDDLLTREINFKSRTYKKENLLILRKSHLSFFEVGIIKLFIIRGKDIQIIVDVFDVERTVLNVYEAVCGSKETRIIRFSDLPDCYPLYRHGNDSSFKFVHHHHVSPCLDD